MQNVGFLMTRLNYYEKFQHHDIKSIKKGVGIVFQVSVVEPSFRKDRVQTISMRALCMQIFRCQCK